MCLFSYIQPIFIPDRSLWHLIIAYKSPEEPALEARDSADSQELEDRKPKFELRAVSNIVLYCVTADTLFLSHRIILHLAARLAQLTTFLVAGRGSLPAQLKTENEIFPWNPFSVQQSSTTTYFMSYSLGFMICISLCEEHWVICTDSVCQSMWVT